MADIVHEYNRGMLTRILTVAAGLLCCVSAAAQSLQMHSPAPLRAGTNHATVESSAGAHYWFFYAEPGHFQIRFSYGAAQERSDGTGHPAAGAVFAPKTPGSVIKYKDLRGGTIWDGEVKQRTRVVVEVDPKKRSVGRQSSAYALTATGDVSFGSGGAGKLTLVGGGAAIVGTYMAKLNDYGAAKFLPNGTITASNGDHGTWKLFDEKSRIYTVVLGGKRFTLTLSPGRGLIDTGNHNLIFELQH